MKRQRLNLRLVATAALTVVIVASLTGIALATPGRGHSSSAQYQYGPAAAQYGPAGAQYGTVATTQGVGLGTPKVCVNHKSRKILKIGAPALQAHLRHGDLKVDCPASLAHRGKAKGHNR